MEQTELMVLLAQLVLQVLLEQRAQLELLV
jgi:hypothetical protein